MSPAVTILVCVDAGRAISAGLAPDNGGVYSASPNAWKQAARNIEASIFSDFASDKSNFLISMDSTLDLLECAL